MARHNSCNAMESPRKSSFCGRGVAAASLAFMGLCISAYLALFQYGWLTHIWDPVFGTGTATVLNFGLLDPVSRLIGLPLHDSALGALAYLLEMGLALLVAHRRAPWLVLIYAATVVLMGVGGLCLVVLQATVVHAGCLLCLISAACSEAIVLLSGQDIKLAWKQMRSL